MKFEQVIIGEGDVQPALDECITIEKITIVERKPETKVVQVHFHDGAYYCAFAFGKRVNILKISYVVLYSALRIKVSDGVTIKVSGEKYIYVSDSSSFSESDSESD
jgi:hypothetical protein